MRARQRVGFCVSARAKRGRKLTRQFRSAVAELNSPRFIAHKEYEQWGAHEYISLEMHALLQTMRAGLEFIWGGLGSFTSHKSTNW